MTCCQQRVFSTSHQKPLKGIQRNLIGSKIPMSSTNFVFLWTDQKNNMAASTSDWLKLFFTSFQKPLNRIPTNLTKSKKLTSSSKIVFFRPISKQKWPSWRIRQKGGTKYLGVRYVALWAYSWFLMLRPVSPELIFPGIKFRTPQGSSISFN